MTPIVSVIVTHHITANEPYLDLCLKSLLKSHSVPYEIIVVSAAEKKPKVPEGVNLFWDKNIKSYSDKIHFGISKMHPESQFMWLVTDDVAVSKDCMMKLQNTAYLYNAITNPLASSDNTCVFVAEIGLSNGRDKVPLKVNMNIEDVAGYEEEIFNYKTHNNILLMRQWVPFFCTMIPKKIWDRVGKLDARLNYRHNDEDYCLRAGRLGYESIINTSCFALHFNAKTIGAVGVNEDKKNQSTRVFINKWSSIQNFINPGVA